MKHDLKTVEGRRAYHKEWRAKNKDKVRKANQNWYDKNADAEKERTRKYREENPEQYQEYWQKRKERYNSDEEFRQRILRQCKESTRRHKDRRAAYEKKRRQENRAKYRAIGAANKAQRALRTPAWADLEAIAFFYECCPKGYEVDHIIPLRGETVSGLHVVENLQWLTPEQNRVKSNAY